MIKLVYIKIYHSYFYLLLSISMHVLISWATGTLWKPLTYRLIKKEWTITVLTRSISKAKKIFWSTVSYIQQDTLNKKDLRKIDAVINLAWSPIYSIPRTQKNKEKIYASRIDTTKQLVSMLSSNVTTYINASAIGYYPKSLEMIYSSEWINNNPNSFMECVCVDREKEANKARTLWRRVILLRTWIVTGETLFSTIQKRSIRILWWLILGSWKQRLPLISKKDWVSNCTTILEDITIKWPVNMVWNCIQQESYVRYLAKQEKRITRIRVPSFIIRCILWEASELFLWSWNTKKDIKKHIKERF